ncbi:hypothetical protein HAX54_011775, partial [Datura stramonium]|nr:hypothetical protein [Datura stramonium]
EELIEAQRVKSMQEAKEVRLAEATRMAIATKFVTALAERNRKHHPHHQGKQAMWNVLYEEEFNLEKVGFTGAIMPLPLLPNAKFDITSTMM